MGYLQAVARAFVAIGAAAGLALKFQVGEPWWWIAGEGRICAYDAATPAALGASSVAIADVRQVLDAPQLEMLDALGAFLAGSTADRKRTRLNSSHLCASRLLSYARTHK